MESLFLTNYSEQKAYARHYTYTPIPVTSKRYRFVALNEMAKRLAQNME